MSVATPAGAALWSRPGRSPFPSPKRAFSNVYGAISIAAPAGRRREGERLGGRGEPVRRSRTGVAARKEAVIVS